MNKNEKKRNLWLTWVEISEEIARAEIGCRSIVSMLKRTRVMLLASLLCISFYPLRSVADGVVLWNKLGSDYEVTHSEVGPNGTIVGSSFAFEVAQFGNGYVRKAIGENYVIFPASLLNGLTRRGTLAVWINPNISQPQPYQYGMFGLVGAPYGWAWLPSGRGNNISLTWGDGVSGLGIQGGVSLGNDVSTPMEPVQFLATPGVPFHVAIIWDIDGIDGTTETVRTYRNGSLIGKATGTWDPSVTPTEDIVLGYGPDDGGYDKFIIDNIVIWDYAKTDFSDRFNENPVGKTFSTFTTSASIKFGPKPNDDSFKVSVKFGLGAESDGIDPVSEKVNITMGNFSTTIPAGEFQQQGTGLFTFKGTINEVNLKAQIHIPQISSGVAAKWFKPMDYWFKLKATGADLDGTVIPPEVNLTIGNDTGQAKLNGGKAQFGQGKNDEHKDDDEQWLSESD
jgi:hypothetical protein